jgi:hypothetical protein
MKTFNLALAFVAVVTCLLEGAFARNLVLIVLSLVIAVAVFLLNRKLEQRSISQFYEDTCKPATRNDVPDFSK